MSTYMHFSNYIMDTNWHTKKRLFIQQKHYGLILQLD